MPAALLRLLPILLGFLAQGKSSGAIKALQATKLGSKIPGLGFLGRHPMATGFGAFLGTEMGASAALEGLMGTEAEAERFSSNDGNLASLLSSPPAGMNENQANLQALLQDDDLLRQALSGGGVF